MGVTVKIGVVCDDRFRNKEWTCERSATLDADLSADGLVKIPSKIDGWTFHAEHYGGQEASCRMCTKLFRGDFG